MNSSLGDLRRAASRLGMSAFVLAWAAVLTATAAAGPLYWDMPAGAPFADCVLDGVRLTAEGYLAPGLVNTGEVTIGEDVVWSQAPYGDGGRLLGTGGQGRVLALGPDGDVTLLAELDCDHVMSLLVMGDGRIVAGCDPGGKVFVFAAGDKPRLVAEHADQYVWDMTAGPDGRVLLAVGSPARVLALDPDSGREEELAAPPAENCVDLALTGPRELLIATQGPGMVLTLDPARSTGPRVLVQTPQDEVGQLVPGPGGGYYALALHESGNGQERDQTASNGDGNTVRTPRPVVLAPDMAQGRRENIPGAALFDLGDPEGPREVWSGDRDLMAVAWIQDLGWVGGGLQGETETITALYRLLPGGGTETLAGWRGGDIIHLMRRGSTLQVVQAGPTLVSSFCLDCRGSRVVTGPVLDAGRPVTWSRLAWVGHAAGGSLRWSVRTGGSAVPDAGWSDWSGSWTDADHALDPDPSRYLQWRAEWAPDVAADLRVTSVSVSAWGENRAPVIASFKRESVTAVRNGGMLSRNPNLTRTFSGGLKAEFSRKEQSERPDPLRRARLGRGIMVFTWRTRDPDGDRLDYRLEARAGDSGSWLPVAEGRDNQLEAWDTTTVPDGVYTVRLTVSDEPDNPGGQDLSAVRDFGPLTVDNTPPRITDCRVRDRDGAPELSFTAGDEGGALASAWLVLDDDRRVRIDPVDRVCDSPREKFRVTVPDTGKEPPVGRVRVEVVDLAGNVAVKVCPLEAP